MKLNTYIILDRQIREAAAVGLITGLKNPEINNDVERLVDYVGDTIMGALTQIIIFDDLVKEDLVKTVDPEDLNQPKE